MAYFILEYKNISIQPCDWVFTRWTRLDNQWLFSRIKLLPWCQSCWSPLIKKNNSTLKICFLKSERSIRVVNKITNFTTNISPLMASEVQSGRVSNNCDHKGEAYCRVVCKVDSDLNDIDVAVQTQETNTSVLSKFISTFRCLW